MRTYHSVGPIDKSTSPYAPFHEYCSKEAKRCFERAISALNTADFVSAEKYLSFSFSNSISSNRRFEIATNAIEFCLSDITNGSKILANLFKLMPQLHDFDFSQLLSFRSAYSYSTLHYFISQPDFNLLIPGTLTRVSPFRSPLKIRFSAAEAMGPLSLSFSSEKLPKQSAVLHLCAYLNPSSGPQYPLSHLISASEEFKNAKMELHYLHSIHALGRIQLESANGTFYHTFDSEVANQAYGSLLTTSFEPFKTARAGYLLSRDSSNPRGFLLPIKKQIFLGFERIFTSENKLLSDKNGDLFSEAFIVTSPLVGKNKPNSSIFFSHIHTLEILLALASYLSCPITLQNRSKIKFLTETVCDSDLVLESSDKKWLSNIIENIGYSRQKNLNDISILLNNFARLISDDQPLLAAYSYSAAAEIAHAVDPLSLTAILLSEKAEEKFQLVSEVSKEKSSEFSIPKSSPSISSDLPISSDRINSVKTSLTDAEEKRRKTYFRGNPLSQAV